jgi:ACS family hexuronate transporter-like MFS transporter
MKAMLVIAFIPLVVLLSQPFGNISFWVPVLLIGIGTSAHQAWSANIFTTVSDMFPQKAIASVVGIGGMAGGFGGVIISKIGGWLFDGYKITGIKDSFVKATEAGLGNFITQIKDLKLLDKQGGLIDLAKKEIYSLPADVQTKLSVALKKIYDGKAFQDFMASRGFGVSYADAKTFEHFMQRADSDMGATMKSVGLVK